MNKQQKAYAVAKAQLETLEAQAKEIEREYIAGHNIANPDGTVPAAIYCIDDEAAFDKANADTAPALDALEIWKAREALSAAEDALINYGLSIMPEAHKGDREKLHSACFGLNGYAKQYNIRDKVIALTFRLDTATVRM